MEEEILCSCCEKREATKFITIGTFRAGYEGELALCSKCLILVSMTMRTRAFTDLIKSIDFNEMAEIMSSISITIKASKENYPIPNNIRDN